MSPEPPLTEKREPSVADAGDARTREGHSGGDGGKILIPADLSPGDAEQQQMDALKIPRNWYVTKWWSLVEHYEGKPEERRTLEKWRWTCRHLISEDWAKVLAGQKRA